ncbi:hypothetical protein FKM82_002126 [Ascaphus truei]
MFWVFPVLHPYPALGFSLLSVPCCSFTHTSTCGRRIRDVIQCLCSCTRTARVSLHAPAGLHARAPERLRALYPSPQYPAVL